MSARLLETLLGTPSDAVLQVSRGKHVQQAGRQTTAVVMPKSCSSTNTTGRRWTPCLSLNERRLYVVFSTRPCSPFPPLHLAVFPSARTPHLERPDHMQVARQFVTAVRAAVEQPRTAKTQPQCFYQTPNLTAVLLVRVTHHSGIKATKQALHIQTRFRLRSIDGPRFDSAHCVL